MYFRIFVIRLYPCWGDIRRLYSVLLSSQKLLVLESVSPRGGRTMVILSPRSKALQKAFFNST